MRSTNRAPDERRAAGQVEVVADQHRGARAPRPGPGRRSRWSARRPGSRPRRRCGHRARPRRRRAPRTGGCGRGRRAAACPPATTDRTPAGVALDRRRREPGQLGHRQVVAGVAEQLGRGHPAGAEHQGDVVPLDAGRLGEGRRRPASPHGTGRPAGGCVPAVAFTRRRLPSAAVGAGRAAAAGPRRSRPVRRPPRRVGHQARGSAPTAARPRRRRARTARRVASPSRVCTRTRILRYRPDSAPSQTSSSRSSAGGDVVQHRRRPATPASSTTVISAPPASAWSPPNVSRQPTSQPVPARRGVRGLLGHLPRVEVAAVRGVQGHAAAKARWQDRGRAAVRTMRDVRVSVVIVGGGPGGYEAALVAAQLGAEVTLVDRDGAGGSAVLTDCVPEQDADRHRRGHDHRRRGGRARRPAGRARPDQALHAEAERALGRRPGRGRPARAGAGPRAVGRHPGRRRGGRASAGSRAPAGWRPAAPSIAELADGGHRAARAPTSCWSRPVRTRGCCPRRCPTVSGSSPGSSSTT